MKIIDRANFNQECLPLYEKTEKDVTIESITKKIFLFICFVGVISGLMLYLDSNALKWKIGSYSFLGITYAVIFVIIFIIVLGLYIISKNRKGKNIDDYYFIEGIFDMSSYKISEHKGYIFYIDNYTIDIKGYVPENVEEIKLKYVRAYLNKKSNECFLIVL